MKILQKYRENMVQYRENIVKIWWKYGKNIVKISKMQNFNVDERGSYPPYRVHLVWLLKMYINFIRREVVVSLDPDWQERDSE